MHMQLTKPTPLRPPKPPTVYVVVKSAGGRSGSKSLTVYNTTPQQVLDAIKRMVESGAESPSPSAA
jgi:hypothetical protein